MIELLLPELRKRGLFWDEYEVPAGTYRENLYARDGQSGLPVDHPAHGYRWKVGESKHRVDTDAVENQVTATSTE